VVRINGSWDRVIDGASPTFGVRLDVRSPGDAMPAGAKCSLRLSDTIEPLLEEKGSLRQDFSGSDDPTGAVATDRLGRKAHAGSAWRATQLPQAA